MTPVRTALLVCAVASVMPAHAQTPADSTSDSTNQTEPTPAPRKKHRFRLGPEIGVFRLTNSRARDRFGGSDVSFGVGFTPLRVPTTRGAFGFDARLIYLKSNGNRVLYVPVGAEYRRALAPVKEGKYGATPYAGATLNLVPTRLKAIPENIDEKFKVALGGSVFLGVSLGEKAFVEARYLSVTKVRGFDLSGASLGAGFRF